jgi:transcription antitermination factor NusA-like protein
MENKEIINLLLRMDIPEPQTKKVKIKRLSEKAGADIVFELKELPYSVISEIHKLDNLSIHIILAGTASPNLKSAELKAKYNAETPAELVKNMLSAGEIEDLAFQIELLSGFRQNTLEEVKKNSTTGTTIPA